MVPSSRWMENTQTVLCIIEGYTATHANPGEFKIESPLRHVPWKHTGEKQMHLTDSSDAPLALWPQKGDRLRWITISGAFPTDWMFHWTFITVWVCAAMISCLKYLKNPERSLSELLWHFLPVSGPLPYIYTSAGGEDHMSNPAHAEQTMNKTVSSQLLMLWPTAHAWIHATHQQQTS